MSDAAIASRSRPAPQVSPLDTLSLLTRLLQGTVTTLEVFTLSACLAMTMAFVAGLMRLAPFWPVRVVARVYVEVFRGTSGLVQLFWLFFVLPHFGISLEPLTVAVVGLGLNVGAYGAEVVRGGILSVPEQQTEAARALGLPRSVTMRKIILPQALVATLPPLGNLLIDLLKATSIVSLITMTDLTFMAYQLNQLTFRTEEIFLMVLLIYLSISLLITSAVRMLERRATAHLRDRT